MRKKICMLFVLFGSCFFCTGSIAQDSSLKKRATSIITTKPPRFPKNIIIKYGIASFYAKKFEGRKTATGDKFRTAKLTAACNVLPLGTWVKVTNLRNDKSVIVQINDRLHYKNQRLIDLTEKAAKQLNFMSAGTTRVKVEVLGRLKSKKE